MRWLPLGGTCRGKWVAVTTVVLVCQRSGSCLYPEIIYGTARLYHTATRDSVIYLLNSAITGFVPARVRGDLIGGASTGTASLDKFLASNLLKRHQ